MSNQDSVRTFVCIEVPESIKSRIGDLQAKLRRTSADVAWVSPSNIHLTLKFLGAVPAGRISAVIEAARRAATATHPFRIRVEGAGCFPALRSPRVLWIGLANVPRPLRELADALEAAMESQGFECETRPFAPHLTIGRIKSARNARNVAQLLTDTGFQLEDFEATELTVMRSDLRPTGAIYTPLSKVRFKESA